MDFAIMITSDIGALEATTDLTVTTNVISSTANIARTGLTDFVRLSKSRTEEDASSRDHLSSLGTRYRTDSSSSFAYPYPLTLPDA